MTLGGQIVKDLAPFGRDFLGRGETVTFSFGGGDPVTPTVVSFSAGHGTEANDEIGITAEYRVVMTVLNDDTLGGDPTRWRTATWRGTDYKIVQPPMDCTDAVVIYELFSIARVETSSPTYRQS